MMRKPNGGRGLALFETPILSQREVDVIGLIDERRQSLAYAVQEPRRWTGVLRRMALARAIRGSNSIEGIRVSLEDALALVDGGPPLDASEETWLAVQGYREAMTYILQLSDDPHFEFEASLVRGLHYMIMQHDLDKRPGLWRLGDIFVVDEATGERIYEGPPATSVPHLMDELTLGLKSDEPGPVLIKAGMAHLNLAMIHPFKDGNGRMARALQTLVLARGGILAPEFSSLEEHLGRVQPQYYNVLAEVGQGSWHPEQDARPWIHFVLTAHYHQVQILHRRVREWQRAWEDLERLVSALGLPERAVPSVFNAAFGARIRNAGYRVDAEVSVDAAGRDLKHLVDKGLFVAEGEKRYRYYVASDVLRQVRQNARALRPPLEDPFLSDLGGQQTLRPA